MADGAYSSSRCGFCKTIWQSNVKDGLFSSICGSPLVKCNKCQKVMKTKYQLYSKLSAFKKIQFWISKSAMGIMGLFFLIAPILDETGEADFLYAIAIILLLLFINHILTARKHISKLENWFIENDGFLWSHQQYPS